METLAKLLGGVQRVKIMRLFLLNAEQGFDIDAIVERSRIQAPIARKVLHHLVALEFVKKRSILKEVEDGRTGKTKKKRVNGWSFNADFPYTKELRQLLVEGDFLQHTDLVRRLRPAGKIQLLVVSGIFMRHSNSRLDILIVGDNLQRNVVQKAIAVLESELGTELSYALFETNDFKYRVSMYDRLLRDLFDFPHQRLLASKEFSTFIMPS